MKIVERDEMAQILGVSDEELRNLEAAGLPAFQAVVDGEHVTRYLAPEVVWWVIGRRLRAKMRADSLH